MNEIFEGMSEKEIEKSPERICIPLGIYKRLQALVEEGEQTEREIGVLLFGQGGVVTHFERCGIQIGYGIATPPEQLENLVKKKESEGLEIMGDFHSHLSILATGYQRYNRDPRLALYPSDADIKGQEGLGFWRGRKLPRLIGCKIRGEPMIKGFVINRREYPEDLEVLPVEVPSVEDEEAGKVDEDLRKGWRIWKETVVKPEELITRGVIKEISIEIKEE